MTIDNVPDTSTGSTNVDQSTTTTSVTQQTDTSSGEDWKSRYTGLQKVVAKKDVTIVELQAKLDKAISDLEEERTKTQSTERSKSELESLKATLETQLTAAQKERDDLNKKLARQSLIAEEFPQLNKLSKYVPSADDDETYRQNAKAFLEDINGVVQTTVKDVMTGATPPGPQGKDAMSTSAEADAAYRAVVTLAGIPGKESEFLKAREKWEKLLINQK